MRKRREAPASRGRKFPACKFETFASRALLGFGIHFVLFRLPFSLNGIIDFLAMNWDIRGSVDSQANLVSSHIDYGYDNIIADHDALVTMS
jgi:hypothetical protein